MKNHWIIKTCNGNNFKNSKFPFWGINKYLLSNIKLMVKDDILWFVTNKSNDNKVIGMAEFIEKSLIKSTTNKNQGWSENFKWDTELHYNKLYNTEKQNIRICLKGKQTIYKYENIKNYNNENLYNHYNGFIFYSQPVINFGLFI